MCHCKEAPDSLPRPLTGSDHFHLRKDCFVVDSPPRNDIKLFFKGHALFLLHHRRYSHPRPYLLYAGLCDGQPFLELCRDRRDPIVKEHTALQASTLPSLRALSPHDLVLRWLDP